MVRGIAGLQTVLVKSKIYAPTGNGIPVIQLSTSDPTTLSILSGYIKRQNVRNATQLIYLSRISGLNYGGKSCHGDFKRSYVEKEI
jgi:hypothetical protein